MDEVVPGDEEEEDVEGVEEREAAQEDSNASSYIVCQPNVKQVLKEESVS